MQEDGVVNEGKVNLLALRKSKKSDCGSACLSAVMKYWGSAITQKELDRVLGPVPKNGYTLEQLKFGAEYFGYCAFLVSGTLDDLKKHCSLGRPCIIAYRVNSKQNHTVVVYKVSKDMSGNDSIDFMDPDTGRMLNRRFHYFSEKWAPLGSPLLLVGKKQENHNKGGKYAGQED